MTPRTLFNIILKIFGIFCMKGFIATLWQLLPTGVYLTNTGEGVTVIWMPMLVVANLLAYGLVSYYLVFKTELIIDKLKLDKGFGQEIIPINIHRSTILSISIIVIGGLLVV